MTKGDFIDTVASECRLSRRDTEAVINQSLKTITKILKDRDSISFVGFGSFTPVKKGAREIVMPGKQKIVKVPPKYSVRFRTGKTLKEAIQ